MSATRHIVACRMGRMEYEPAWNLQRRLQQRLVADKRAVAPTCPPHVFLMVEHPPVFTLGKSGDASNLLADEAMLARAGAKFVQIDRGGDITYHGPGQVVGYPILDLDRFYTDIHRYLRDLEEVVIRTCAAFGVATSRFEDRTGVWVVNRPGQERKICAMGIRCSRWVTMHGFALNVNTNLDHFNMIVPCGISDRTVTSLEAETGGPVDISRVQKELVARFADVFDSDMTLLGEQDAQSFLQMYLEEEAASI